MNVVPQGNDEHFCNTLLLFMIGPIVLIFSLNAIWKSKAIPKLFFVVPVIEENVPIEYIFKRFQRGQEAK